MILVIFINLFLFILADNNFDMPDRTFHSLATTWRLITNDSPTDVKELIPELFYLPELFYNNEGNLQVIFTLAFRIFLAFFSLI